MRTTKVPDPMPSDIVSLKTSLNYLERSEFLLAKSLGCYLDALKGVDEHVLRPFAAKTGEHPLSLEPSWRQLKAEQTEATLDGARKALDRSLRSTSEKLQRQLAGAVELNEVLRLLDETMSGLQRRGTDRECRVINVASNLEAAAKLDNIAEFRERIQAQIRNLATIVSEMREENRQVIAELEREMKFYRKKLDEASQASHLDFITGLNNRRMFQTRVDEHVRAGLPFCLLVIDLDRLKTVNEQHGHAAGDEFLRLISARLRKQLRADDVASRWGGDEFMIVLACSLRDAMLRAQAIEQSLRGVYTLQLPDRVVRIPAGVTMGVAEHQSGESAEHLLCRADSLLNERGTAGV